MTSRRLASPLALLALTSAAAPAGATEKVPQAQTEGAPTIAPGAGPGYWLWHDAAGWHLRWTGGAADKKSVFTGLLNVPQSKISVIKPAGMSGGDDSLNRLDGTRAMFKSESAATVEGIDFKTGEGATSLYLELFTEYDVISPKSVHLGKDAVAPVDMSPMLQIDLQSGPAGAP